MLFPAYSLVVAELAVLFIGSGGEWDIRIENLLQYIVNVLKVFVLEGVDVRYWSSVKFNDACIPFVLFVPGILLAVLASHIKEYGRYLCGSALSYLLYP